MKILNLIILLGRCTYLYNCNHLVYFNRYIILKAIARHYCYVSEFVFK